MDSLRTQLIALVAEHLGMTPEQVASVNGLDELGIDSLGVIDMIGLVESYFNIQIPNDRLDSVNSLDDLVRAVDSMIVANA